MKRKRILLSRSLVFASLSLIVATFQCAPKKSGLVVGFSQIGAESDWRTAETSSIREEAKKRGISLKFSDAQQKQENQIKALRAFASLKVQAVILAPVVESGWSSVFKELKAASIPVVLVDRGVDADPSLYTTKIASNFIEQGRKAAKCLAKMTKGKGKIVELQGTPGAAPTLDRKKGFKEQLKAYPQLKIIKSQPADFTRFKGKEVMEAFLKSGGKNIDAVYCHNDDMCLGAINAIEEYGLKPGEDIVLVSVDAVSAAFESMIQGKLNCTVECNPLLGEYVFDVIEKVLKGEKVPKEIIVKDEVFTQNEAAAVLPSRKY